VLLRCHPRLYLEFQSHHDRHSRDTSQPNFSARPDIPGGHLDRVGREFPGHEVSLVGMAAIVVAWADRIVGAAALALIAVLQRQSLAVPHKMRLRLVLVSLLAITSWVALMGLALL
jgi:hypothetical protein